MYNKIKDLIMKTEIIEGFENKDLTCYVWDDVKNHVPSGVGNKGFFFGGDDSATADDGEVMTPEAKRYALYIGIFILVCLAYVVFRYARKKYRENI